MSSKAAAAAAAKEALLIHAVSADFLVTAARVVTATLFFWDYFITLGDEVNWVWKPRKVVASYLYLLNRYFAFLVTIETMFTRFSPGVRPHAICEHIVLIEGATTVIQINLTELMVVMRVASLWGGNKLILAWLLIYLSGQIIAMSVLLTFIIPFPVPSPVKFLSGCAAAGKPTIGNFPIVIPLLPFVFDVMAFLLMIIAIRRASPAGTTGLLKLMLEDGTLYFLVLCSANLAFLVTDLVFTDERKVLLAPFAQTIGVILINRMLTNLRSFHTRKATVYSHSDTSTRLDAILMWGTQQPTAREEYKLSQVTPTQSKFQDA